MQPSYPFDLNEMLLGAQPNSDNPRNHLQPQPNIPSTLKQSPALQPPQGISQEIANVLNKKVVKNDAFNKWLAMHKKGVLTTCDLFRRVELAKKRP